MKTQTPHTPTPWKSIPWRVDKEEKGPQNSTRILASHPLDFPKTIAITEKEETAAFIVRAVNAHEELVELLKQCVEQFELHEQNFDIGDAGMCDKLEKAIAKAEDL